MGFGFEDIVFKKIFYSLQVFQSCSKWWFFSRVKIIYVIYMSLPPIRQDLTQGQWPEGQLKVGILGRGMLGTSPAGLCWSSTYLVQCGPDEPSWSWTQIWVQACIPAYSLNWTARSSAIEGEQRCQCCSSSTQRWPSWNQGPFSLESTIDFDTLSGMNARRPNQGQGSI